MSCCTVVIRRRAFCVEKNSAAPDVQFKGSEGVSATLVVPYVEYVLTEVLKNSLQVRVGGGQGFRVLWALW